MKMEENNKHVQPNSKEEGVQRLNRILSESLIKATDTYKTPPQIIWVDNSSIATLGNFSASTGKAKAKKTFNVSALVAASLSNGKVLNYRASLPEGKRKILYVARRSAYKHRQRESGLYLSEGVHTLRQDRGHRLCACPRPKLWTGHHRRNQRPASRHQQCGRIGRGHQQDDGMVIKV